MATIVPPPVLDNSLQRALLLAAQPIGAGLAAFGQQRQQQQQFRQSLGGLLGVNPAQAQFNQLAQLGGLPQGQAQPNIGQFNQFRGITDPQAQQAILGGLIGQQFAPPPAGFTLGQGQQRFDAQGNPIADVPAAVAPSAPFTLSPGQQRFDAQGNPIAQVAPAPPKPTLRAGDLQVAKLNDPSGLPEGTVFQEDPQGNVKIISKPGEAGGLDKAEKDKLAVTQAKEFRADSRIQNLQIVERSERGMQAALKLSLKPGAKSRIASDQALGVLFQKMLDPTSVVRESEFARTPEGAALM
ncbi:hypothetical protein LCGC14_0891480, partial [marine sediment metagenome]